MTETEKSGAPSRASRRRILVGVFAVVCVVVLLAIIRLNSSGGPSSGGPNTARPNTARPTAGGPTAAPRPPATGPTSAAGPTAPPPPGARGPHVSICGNSALLTGPAAPPPGAVRVDPGQDLQALTQASPPGTTFWLAPGTHTLGADQFDQVVPKDGNTYVGAPGAVFDGRRVNRFAFSQHASNVSIRYLMITGFGAMGINNNEGAVNHDSGTSWTVEFNTITANAGAGVMVGDSNTIGSNCLSSNGQYGFSVYTPAGARNVTVTGNEITGNNTDDWETRQPGCGCTGGAKFWDTSGGTVTNNWVHDNRGVGLFFDTDNVGFRIEDNTIEANDSEGLVYETSYNARIANNTLARNAIVRGKQLAARGDNFPIGAIYVSESGGDGRLNGGTYATLQVTANRFVDNWGGVVLWENADRFCGSTATNSTTYCTLGGAATQSTCAPGTIAQAPYLSDCRWKTQNVSVDGNTFELDRAAIGCEPSSPCGQQAVLSNFGTVPDWSPYKGRAVQDAIVYHQNNRFANNTYTGAWVFTAYQTGNSLSLAAWQDRYHEDQGSSSR